MLSTVFFNQSLNSTLIEALMVSTSNYEMRGSLFLGIDASFNLKFRIAIIASDTCTNNMVSSYCMIGCGAGKLVIRRLPIIGASIPLTYTASKVVGIGEIVSSIKK